MINVFDYEEIEKEAEQQKKKKELEKMIVKNLEKEVDELNKYTRQLNEEIADKNKKLEQLRDKNAELEATISEFIRADDNATRVMIERARKIDELNAQIEKMKRCTNCSRAYYSDGVVIDCGYDTRFEKDKTECKNFSHWELEK